MADNIIKNPNRRTASQERAQYTPEHKRLDIQPQQMNFSGVRYVDGAAAIISSMNNRHPSAPPIVPESIDPNDMRAVHPVKAIDNNHYMNFGSSLDMIEEATESGGQMNFDEKMESSFEEEEPESQAIAMPRVGEYLLMVGDVVVLSGSASEVQTRMESILYNDDADYQISSSDELILLKRVRVKVGVHIDE